jgi:hypothetical protein
LGLRPVERIQWVAGGRRNKSTAGGIESESPDVYDGSTGIKRAYWSKRLALFWIVVELFGCLLGHCERWNSGVLGGSLFLKDETKDSLSCWLLEERSLQQDLI